MTQITDQDNQRDVINIILLTLIAQSEVPVSSLSGKAYQTHPNDPMALSNVVRGPVQVIKGRISQDLGSGVRGPIRYGIIELWTLGKTATRVSHVSTDDVGNFEIRDYFVKGPYQLRVLRGKKTLFQREFELESREIDLKEMLVKNRGEEKEKSRN